MNRYNFNKPDSRQWKEIQIEYLEDSVTVKVPPTCDILSMKSIPPLKNTREEIESAFDYPIDSQTIEEIVTSQSKSADVLTVSIAVSDNTRPVPYNCDQENNILDPILQRLEKAGILKENIKIIIGCGTHVETNQAWKKKAFGRRVLENYNLIDHSCYAEDLVSIGDVMGVPVKINRSFITADIHIVTGLVETHFMAGASGGRKAVCPGMVNIGATQVFHGPEFMANPKAESLNLDCNPCHEFALEVAKRTRVDYNVNVLMNGEHEICGIYTGHLETSHQKAVEQLRHFSVVNLNQPYDIVLTHGGKGAVNHYQSIKGAWGALPAVKKEGMILLLAHNQDSEPIGSSHYKDLMARFMAGKLGDFKKLIQKPDWSFVHDQWELQKWEQFFERMG